MLTSMSNHELVPSSTEMQSGTAQWVVPVSVSVPVRRLGL